LKKPCLPWVSHQATVISANTREAITINYNKSKMNLFETDLTKNDSRSFFRARKVATAFMFVAFQYDSKLRSARHFFISRQSAPDRKGMEVYEMWQRIQKYCR